MAGSESRVVATRVLDAVLHHGRSLKAELSNALPQVPDPRDRALVEAICFAVLRQPARLDAALKAWVPKPLPRRDLELRALLMVGFVQLDPMRLPSHAAVAATVDAARALGRAHQAGMVNALLRRAQREGLPTVAAHANWPQWLRDALARDWPDEVNAIIEAGAQEPPLWLRVNVQQGRREQYHARLQAEGIEAVDDSRAPDALCLRTAVPVASLPGFAQGAVSVQDAAAQLVVDALQPLQASSRVLDACAAPGGKTAHLLERDASITVTALDIDERRLSNVRKTLERLQLHERARLRAADASALDAWWDGTPFDAVLLDAPCSATGIVRRQPDVLLHRRETDLDALQLLQARLLDALWRTLRPGGVFVYATCSVLKAENEAQVEAFLARTPDAQAEPLDERFGRISGAGRQRLPGENGYDGFFYARLRKRDASGG